MKLIYISVAAYLLFILSAQADDMSLVKSANIPEHIYKDVNLDVLGIRFGMSQNDVKAILNKEYEAEPKNEEGTIGINYNGIMMNSQTFVKQMTDQKNNSDDSIIVAFAYPTSGGGVVGVTRKLQFRNSLSAPTVVDLIKQLNMKYGPASQPITDFDHKSSVRAFWTFGSKGLANCPNNSCIFVSPTMDVQSTFSASALKVGIVAEVMATISLGGPDPSRAQDLEVSIKDNEAEVSSSKEAFIELQAAAKAVYDKKAVPAATPRL